MLTNVFIFGTTVNFPDNPLHDCFESTIPVTLSSQRRNKTNFSKQKMFVELIWKKKEKKKKTRLEVK